MKLNLKEEPGEWFKFTAVVALIPAVFAFGLFRKHHLSRPALLAVWTALAAILAVCAMRPRWFRGFYRAGRTLSFQVGQRMGPVLLALFFLAALTPLALLLRLLGKDLLELKRRPADTYWRPARGWSRFDRLF